MKYPETGYTPANLKYLREQYGLTLYEVAKRTGTAVRTVQNWETPLELKTHAGMPHRKWVILLKSLE
ncbi:helix-turn-helix domain-containing protein [Neisseria sp.]|uniref:helix-turn-helix domain-containing protein n=1 Tax=Neisseria sp. TaxID=192066 RepID=UPI00359F41D9